MQQVMGQFVEITPESDRLLGEAFGLTLPTWHPSWKTLTGLWWIGVFAA